MTKRERQRLQRILDGRIKRIGEAKTMLRSVRDSSRDQRLADMLSYVANYGHKSLAKLRSDLAWELQQIEAGLPPKPAYRFVSAPRRVGSPRRVGTTMSAGRQGEETTEENFCPLFAVATLLGGAIATKKKNPRAEAEKKHEVFHFLSSSWDIDVADRILATSPREPRVVDITDVCEMTGFIRIDPKTKKKADLTIPIYLAPLKDKRGVHIIPIDGWHRIARACDEGIEELPAIFFTEKEARKIRIR